MTALAEAENKIKGLLFGAVDYITKPFAQEKVLARVKLHRRLKQLTDLLEHTQIQLVQQEKLSALGQLIARIGRELNNPLDCIASNLAPAQQYLDDFLELFVFYQEEYPQPTSRIANALEDLDLPFALADFSKLLASMRVATTKERSILNWVKVQSLYCCYRS